MKNNSQCLMCKYVFGRTCKKTNEGISDEIYNNSIVCKDFISISNDIVEVEDSCCSEVKRFSAYSKKE